MQTLRVHSFYDKDTSTITHILWDEETKDAVIIDPVMDFDPVAWKTTDGSVATLVSFCRAEGLKPHYVLETHAHADHLSGSQIFKNHFPQCRVAIGREITQVQATFGELFHLSPLEAQEFDLVYSEDKPLVGGSLTVEPIHTPGHTPACYCLKIGDHVFVGDVIFAPDLGTGRCDFPGGDPVTLYRSLSQKLFTLPNHMVVHFGHDYPPPSRTLCTAMPLGELKTSNVKISVNTPEELFVRERTARDKTLPLPRLIYQSLFVNIRAGKLPQPEENGKRYFKIPMS